jgi:hypothetical protein
MGNKPIMNVSVVNAIRRNGVPEPKLKIVPAETSRCEAVGLRALHSKPYERLACPIETHDASFRVEYDNQRSHGIENRGKNVALFHERGFNLFQLGGIDRHSVTEPRPICARHKKDSASRDCTETEGCSSHSF